MSKLYYAASGIFNTRCCKTQFWPPDDEHYCRGI